jgi:hypothetical protein
VLFSLLGAVILAGLALYIAATAGRGPAHTFRLVPVGNATSAQLDSDAADLVRRLEGLGHGNAGSSVSGHSILVTLYGSSSEVTTAIDRVIPQGRLLVRPVECLAGAYQVMSGGTSSMQSPSASSCAAKYRLTPENLNIDTGTGKPIAVIGPDPGVSNIPTTSPGDDLPSGYVVLPTTPSSGFAAERLVLGPSAVGYSELASAEAQKRGGGWMVGISLTSAGMKQLQNLAKEQFHSYIAVDLDGEVVETPLIEGSSPSFRASGLALAIGGQANEIAAQALADDLTTPLEVPLRLASSTPN